MHSALRRVGEAPSGSAPSGDGSSSSSSGGESATSSSAWLHRCAALRGADPLIEGPDWQHFMALDATAETRLKRALGVGVGTPAAAALSAAVTPPPPPPAHAPSGSGVAAAKQLRTARGSSPEATTKPSAAASTASAAPSALLPTREEAEALLGRLAALLPLQVRRPPDASGGGQASKVGEDGDAEVAGDIQITGGAEVTGGAEATSDAEATGGVEGCGSVVAGGADGGGAGVTGTAGMTEVEVEGGRSEGAAGADVAEASVDIAEATDAVANEPTAAVASEAGAAADCSMQTAWILKSVNMSRGRGIYIEADLATILARFQEKEHKLIAQRYIERPLLIRKRKFDIRQWVLVSSVNPLVVWRYSNYYLRFSSMEYSGDIGSGADYRFAHLTNQSIQKKCDEYGGAIEANMWSRAQFHSHLIDELGSEEGAATAAAVEERINSVCAQTLRSVSDVIEPRAGSFELYGIDLMVDRDYGVWLLEANSSPDMSRNAAPLRQIVDDGLDDLLNVVIDLQYKRTTVSKLAAERAACETPCWRLAYKAKALEERELMRRRFRKKCGADSLAVALAAQGEASSKEVKPAPGRGQGQAGGASAWK